MFSTKAFILSAMPAMSKGLLPPAVGLGKSDALFNMSSNCSGLTSNQLSSEKQECTECENNQGRHNHALFVRNTTKAYIPLRRKTICVGSWRWLRPPTPQFRFGDTNMLVSKNAQICVTPKENLKICVSPNASQWNIGCVGSQKQISRVGHVHFFYFFSRFHSRCWVPFFSGIWALG